jgi:L-lactate dehydrogenase complex protein LldG
MISESTLPPVSPLVGILPEIPPEDLLAKFEAELTKVAGIAHRAADRQELEAILETILSHANATSVVLSRNPLLGELNLEERLRAWGKATSVWQPSGAGDAPGAGDAFLKVSAKASFAATVGITGVEFALAETGSLVVTSWTEGAQLASLAPPVHVALYRRSQLVASLDEVLERLPMARAPEQAVPGRSVVFITGTSRTADIEQILIRGVHGPGELHAILVETELDQRTGAPLIGTARQGL